MALVCHCANPVCSANGCLRARGQSASVQSLKYPDVYVGGAPFPKPQQSQVDAKLDAILRLLEQIASRLNEGDK